MKVLGKGPFCNIYLAESRYDKTPFVVKEILIENGNLNIIYQYTEELKIIEKLNKFEHPNL